MDLAALEAFASHLHPSSRVLDAGCGAGLELAWFSRKGFQADGVDREPAVVEKARLAAPQARVWHGDLASLPRETYDGIWAHQLFPEMDAAFCQRVLGTLFAALKPARGILFASIRVGRTLEYSSGVYEYSEADFASLLRQFGFQVLSQGSPARGLDALQQSSLPALGFIARRL
ncbi:MAG: class I SAM-dependent methyltransferase [Bdellovibrionota bacterium]